MKLKEGVYENLISSRLTADMKETEAEGGVCKTEPIDAAESAKLLADFLAHSIRRKLEDTDVSVEEKIEFTNRILASADIDDVDMLAAAPQLLSAVVSKQRDTELKKTKKDIVRPLSGFRVSNLFTGGQSSLSLGSEIMRDIASADEICIIVSFLRMSGIRMMLNQLADFCKKEGHRLRVITTTYCGVTEAKAVERLSQLPNTEIRISYNTTIERLHAKSYIFVRNSGFSTAYIGSSNLSHSAQTEGLEWNLRVTNVENPHIIKSALATFERYWHSENFEDFSVGGIEKFRRELALQKSRNTSSALEVYARYQVLPHQKIILDRLQVERDENHLYRNLVVAATGTGKTVISAFDYKRFRQLHPQHNRLLFVVHREEILKQSLRTFRSVLGDANFGELWVGNCHPEDSMSNLFVSVATLNNNIDVFRNLGFDYYDYIIIDEAHHAAATSYRVIVDHFRPKILLGLTATPERMDGQSLLPDFGGKISAEIRLPQALDEGLLTPFQYLCITDPLDISGSELWNNGKYILSKLSDCLCNSERVKLIVEKLHEYLPDETKCHALCFCSDKRHAMFMAEQLSQSGLQAAALTSASSNDDRVRLNRDLAAGRINYLCVIDIFNEGVDIPEIDTVLFLRPTDSLTIFLQQLGRGLRLSAGKDFLTVLDFVAQVNKQYDFSSRFRSLCLRKDRSIEEQVANGFTLLPHGCSIYMESKAKSYILNNIHSAIYNTRRLIKELMAYDTVPTLAQFVENCGQDVRLIYKGNNCWTTLKSAAGKCQPIEHDAIGERLMKGIGNLTHINSVAFLRFIKRFIANGCKLDDTNDTGVSNADDRFAIMLYYALFQEKISKLGFDNIYEALYKVDNYPLLKQEIAELIDYLHENLEFKTYPMGAGLPEGLELYGCYTREEVFALFGRQTADKRMQGVAAGVFSIDESNIELFFVTLNKSEKDFSPSTNYNDYFISERRFHWQSQNTMSHANAGARYVNHCNNGRRFLLFVREDKKDGYGNTSPYYCMGLVDYVSSHGNFPMNIEWQLKQPAMAKFIKAV